MTVFAGLTLHFCRARAFQHSNATAWDVGGREIMSKAILHIWIPPHHVQIVNLNREMQFAPSKVSIFISYEEMKPHPFLAPRGKEDGMNHKCRECLKDLEAIFS